jgi:stage V sporulation protein B
MIPARLPWRAGRSLTPYPAFGVLFGMTMPMLTLPMVLIIGLGLVMVPKLSESAAVGDTRAVRRKIAKAMLVVCTLSMPIAAFFVPLGETIGKLIFNNPNAGSYMAPLSICVTLYAVQGILGTALNGIGKQRLAAVNFLIGGSVQLACTWF